MCMHSENIGFSSSFIGFLVGLYITIHPHLLLLLLLLLLLFSHNFAVENCAIGNIVKQKMGSTV